MMTHEELMKQTAGTVQLHLTGEGFEVIVYIQREGEYTRVSVPGSLNMLVPGQYPTCLWMSRDEGAINSEIRNYYSTLKLESGKTYSWFIPLTEEISRKIRSRETGPG